MTNAGIRTHRRTPARDADSPAASTQRRLALREVLRFASLWTRSLTGAGSPEPLDPCTPQAGPEHSEAAEQPPTHPRLRCSGAAASCPPRRGGPTGPPCHRFQPSRPTALVGRCGETHTDRYGCTRMQTRQDRPWEVVTSPHIAKRFFLHHGRQERLTANSSVPRANPPPTRPRHTPPGMMRGARRPRTCLLFQPYMAQGNPKRALCASHPSPAPDER